MTMISAVSKEVILALLVRRSVELEGIIEALPSFDHPDTEQAVRDRQGVTLAKLSLDEVLIARTEIILTYREYHANAQ